MRHVYSQLAFAVMAAVCAAALRWGGRLERRTAVLFASAWVVTLLAQGMLGQVAPVAVLVGIDALVFGLLVVLSWRDRAGWTVWAIASQGVALGVHLIRAVSPAMPTWTYLTALTLTSYAALAALAWGTWVSYSTRPGVSS